MAKLVLTFVVCLAGIVGNAHSQEVIIPGFPPGIGGSIAPELLQPFHSALKAIADTLKLDPAARAVITGGADGIEYFDGHDAKNPGLALGRAHVLRNLFVVELGVDSAQLVIMTQETPEVGDAFRFASVRLVRAQTPDYEARLKALEDRPPVEKHFTETKELVAAPFIENLGLQASAGIHSSPFGGMPAVAAAITWKRIIFVEGFFGHTIWKNEYRYGTETLETRRRLAGGLAVLYPRENLPIGFVGGWLRIEEISLTYYDYVRLSEGPIFGLRVTPVDYLSVTAAWNPARHRVAGSDLSQYKDNQLLVSIMAHKTFGGSR